MKKAVERGRNIPFDFEIMRRRRRAGRRKRRRVFALTVAVGVCAVVVGFGLYFHIKKNQKRDLPLISARYGTDAALSGRDGTPITSPEEAEVSPLVASATQAGMSDLMPAQTDLSEPQDQALIFDKAVPFSIKVLSDDVMIRESASVNGSEHRFCPQGSYTIVEISENDGTVWGKLKSGEGWIDLEEVIIP